ncbi:hypothetical protein M3Y95_01175400 [Aphelenchoides besseyi]|nr:hypothetical protein M3Y95_01175400 [Aphelenchoides besseyi]
MWLLQLLLLINLSTAESDVEVGQIEPVDQVVPLERPCNPLVNREWTPIPHDPHRFLFCHPIRRVFVEEACRKEMGVRKLFNPLTQRCVLPSTTTETPTTTTQLSTTKSNVTQRRHPIYSRYGIVGSELLGQKLRLSRPLAEVESDRSSRLLNSMNLECPIGRLPKRQSNSLEPVTCNSNDSRACGSSEEFRCTFENATTDHGVCCQRLPIGLTKCPPQMTPLVEADSTVRACGKKPGLCRAVGSVCVFDESTGDFHCCVPEPPNGWEIESNERPTTAINVLYVGGAQKRPTRFQKPRISNSNAPEEEDGCPRGESAFYDLRTGSPLQCNAELIKEWQIGPSVCPYGFYCRASRSKGAQCCGSNGGFCPLNSAILTSPTNGKRVTCSRQGTGCPEGYFCDLRTHTCCALEPLTAKCPYGLAAYQTDGRARRCKLTPCPDGYECSNRYNESFCCPTAERVCTMKQNDGLHCPSSTPERLFYYDAETGECRPFNFSGCSGSDNRFKTYELCETFCHLTNICPLGAPLRRADGQLITCNDGRSCGQNFTCHSTYRGKFCCQLSESSVCPVNTKSYVSKGKPMECQEDRECPSFFRCVRDQRYLNGYCCSGLEPARQVETKKLPTDLNVCTDGQQPLRTPDKEIQICLFDDLYGCPNAYECQLNSYYGRYQCCPTKNSTAVIEMAICPVGMNPQFHPTTREPVSCEPEEEWQSGCPPFSKCEYSHGYRKHICCEPDNLKTLLEMTKKTSPFLWKGIRPAQFGCIQSYSCMIVDPNTRCIDWVCHCTNGLVAFKGACVKECPTGYLDSSGLCIRLKPDN